MNNHVLKVSILLLNYNGKSFNKNCINSILNQSYKDFEIIFIDNNSTDGSLEELETTFSKEIRLGIIKIVKNKENLWFAGGNNSGIPFVSKESEYIRLLNNDTVIDRNCLQELIKGIESDNQLGAVSSLILDRGYEEIIKKKNNEGQVRITNVFGLQIREKGEVKDNILYTNFLCGCSFLYKKLLVDKPFFDFYKCYAEDLELSREILIRGYKLGICKNSIVNHFGSGTMKRNPKYLQSYYDNRNLLINYIAFFNILTRIRLFIPSVTFQTLQLISNISHFGLLLKAKFNSLLWVIKNKEKINLVKKRINSKKVLTENELLSLMSGKMADDSFYTSMYTKKLAKILNCINKLYYKIMLIPSR